MRISNWNRRAEKAPIFTIEAHCVIMWLYAQSYLWHLIVVYCFFFMILSLWFDGNISLLSMSWFLKGNLSLIKIKHCNLRVKQHALIWYTRKWNDNTEHQILCIPISNIDTKFSRRYLLRIKLKSVCPKLARHIV